MSLYFGDKNRPVSQEVLDTIAEYEKNEFALSAKLDKCFPYKSRHYGHFSYLGGIIKIPLDAPLIIGAYYQLRGYCKKILADKSRGNEPVFTACITNIIRLPIFFDDSLKAPTKYSKPQTKEIMKSE